MEKKETVLIICDGHLPEKNWLEAEFNRHVFTVACDGAGNTLLGLELTPNVVIGDLDSFDLSLKTNAFRLIQDTDQETNDLEKALQYVWENGFQQVTIIGALGKRTDHTLKNLSVLMRFDARFQELIIKDEFGISCMAREKVQLQAPIGTAVSLIPMSGVVSGITTKGLKYELNNEFLANGKRDGTSNETTELFAEIEIISGELLLFLGVKQEETISLKRF
jgi:thiamine pyrophosphokinase